MSDRITPFLWFDGRVEEAVEFYTSIFKNSKVESANEFYATINLDGRDFIIFNGGRYADFPLTEAFSMFVRCETQEEVDYYWEKLSAGGREVQCGWLQDKFGLFWQVVPNVLHDMLNDPDQAKAKRAHESVLTMVKLDIATLKKAYAGEV